MASWCCCSMASWRISFWYRKWLARTC
jgi:hypothetical protein